MDEGARDLNGIVSAIRRMAAAESFRVTQHAGQEMVEEDISLQNVLEAIQTGQIIEDYLDHKRGPFCLLHGRTAVGRDLHVVCTTTPPVLIIITVYEPKPPKWPTPTVRSRTT